MALPLPSLQLATSGSLRWWTDPGLTGIVVAFSERTGGVSSPPYSSLNLAAHVDDDPAAVDANRRLLLDALDLAPFADRLTTATQVHGTRIARIDEELAGSGARATSGPAPIADADGLMTGVAGIPLLLLYADCVPVVVVAPTGAVAVLHAGWRGALGGIVGEGIAALCAHAGCGPDEVNVYVGPHIGGCHFEVSPDVGSQFARRFGTVSQVVPGRVDLAAVVSTSSSDAGVDPCRIAVLGACTVETTDRFFSFRAESGLTGRHGALACIVHS